MPKLLSAHVIKLSTLWALEKDEVAFLFLVQQYRMNCAPNTYLLLSSMLPI